MINFLRAPLHRLPSILFLITVVVAGCRHQLLREAEYHERGDQLDKAEAAIIRYLDLYPQDAGAHFWLARIYGERQEYDRMIHHLTQAKIIDGGLSERVSSFKEHHWRVNYNSGVQSLRLGDMQVAAQALRNAILIQPARHEAYPLLGAALLAEADTGEVAKVFEAACELKPDDLDSRRALQRVYFQRGMLRPALRTSELILTIEPGDVDALKCRALVLQKMADEAPDDSLTKSAEKALKDLLLESPHPDHYTLLGVHYYQRGDFPRAAIQFEEAYRFGSDSREVLKYLGDCAWQSGDFANMSLWYSRLLQRSPLDLEVMQNLLIAEQALGRTAAAQELRTRLQELRGGKE